MSPEEFCAKIVPAVLKSWNLHCLCGNAGFRKLLSFNFKDYGAGPMALADSEILSHHIIRQIFSRTGEVKRTGGGDIRQEYSCPQCNMSCIEEYAEFSISMNRSYFRFLDSDATSSEGVYLVGIRAFSRDDFVKVRDFREAASTQEFLASIGAA